MSAHKLSLRVVIGEVKRQFGVRRPSASGDGALDRSRVALRKDPERRRRLALPAHSKFRLGRAHLRA